MQNVKARADAIAQSIKTIRLGSVDLAVAALSDAIEDLVDEATFGHPQPVLPPHDKDAEEKREETGYGIFHTESADGPRFVFFGRRAEADARRELARRQGLHEDDEDRLSEDHCVCRCLCAMLVWNSVDRDPRAATEA